MLSFQKLDVYRLAIQFLVVARRIRRQLPRGYADLSDQLKRSSHSTPLNIAEGAGRMTLADKGRHYGIARGSAMESASTLDIMQAEDVIEPADYAEGIELLERIVAMLTKMMPI